MLSEHDKPSRTRAICKMHIWESISDKVKRTRKRPSKHQREYMSGAGGAWHTETCLGSPLCLGMHSGAGGWDAPHCGEGTAEFA